MSLDYLGLVVSLIFSFIAVFSRSKVKASLVLHTEDKRWLLHHTNFSEEELDRLYLIFKTDYPRGGMFRSQVGDLYNTISLHSSFSQQFASFFPPGLAREGFIYFFLFSNIKKTLEHPL